MKKVGSKKRKYLDAEIARAAAVADAAERAEAGGRRSGVVIADRLSPGAHARLRQIEDLHGSPPGTMMMAGRCLAIEEPQLQWESQQQPLPHPQPAEPIEQAQKGEQAEETEHAPQP